jgi:glycosyltransferase involved in cell wall biosynthesis
MKSLTILSTIKNIKDTCTPWLDSLINQDYAGKFEIVIIDSLSTDGTKEIVNEYSLTYKNIHIITTLYYNYI